MAKIFGEKFSLISPVWLQIQPSKDDSSKPYLIGGSHDIDGNWVAEVKKNNALLVPRILFDKVTLTILDRIFQKYVDTFSISFS